jgi:hypothetical protein
MTGMVEAGRAQGLPATIHFLQEGIFSGCGMSVYLSRNYCSSSLFLRSSSLLEYLTGPSKARSHLPQRADPTKYPEFRAASLSATDSLTKADQQPSVLSDQEFGP